jgi:hypothetical protein
MTLALRASPIAHLEYSISRLSLVKNCGLPVGHDARRWSSSATTQRRCPAVLSGVASSRTGARGPGLPSGDPAIATGSLVRGAPHVDFESREPRAALARANASPVGLLRRLSDRRPGCFGPKSWSRTSLLASGGARRLTATGRRDDSRSRTTRSCPAHRRAAPRSPAAASSRAADSMGRPVSWSRSRRHLDRAR